MKKKKINFSKEQKQEMINLIKEYFYQERDEDLGDLAADMILTFFIEKLAPCIYNQGVEDAYTFMSDKLQDIFEIQMNTDIWY
ncbi:MAG: DUF2164 domain-containing protein [Epulopiscium sp.]|nr:DUF2164 domain-containing protein [Candidatus Epulonipiscium sp.]